MKKEIEKWYEQQDPWLYETTEDDKLRKAKILSHCDGHYKRALDIGAGEGFITRDLPSKVIHAYEISDNASSRLPDNVSRVTELKGKYDLIIATGVMYKHYDWWSFIDIIKNHASGKVIISSIKDWEVSEIKELGEPIYTEEFPYREYIQTLKIYDFTS